MKTSHELEQDKLLSISLFLRGDNMRYSQVSEVLECQPDKFWLKGHKMVGKSGKTIIRNSGLWSISLVSKSGSLIETISNLFSRLKTRNNLFSVIEGLEQAELSVFYSQDSCANESDKLAIVFPASILKIIYDLGVTLSFDISFVQVSRGDP